MSFVIHNKSHTPEYHVWAVMKYRCSNSNSNGYHHYGGRGISVCPEWNDFQSFINDMGPRPSDRHSLDRIDNDGNYEPSNCRWATPQEQASNRRTNHWIRHNGMTKTVKQWSVHLNVKDSMIHHRLRAGWTISDTLDTPPGGRPCPRRVDHDLVNSLFDQGHSFQEIALSANCSDSRVRQIIKDRKSS